jgi:hypothetical protein
MPLLFLWFISSSLASRRQSINLPRFGLFIVHTETAGRSLEDMDVIFALAHIEGVSPVKVSLRKDLPAAGSPEADAILEDTTSFSQG